MRYLTETDKRRRRARRVALAIEAGMWASLAALALAWTLFMMPGKGIPRSSDQRHEIEPLRCVEWARIESTRDPAGEPLGEIRYCARYSR